MSSKFSLDGVKPPKKDNAIKKAATEIGQGVSKKKDLGRPKLASGKKLVKKITLNLTEAEEILIKKNAKTELPVPLSASNYVRYKLQKAGILTKDQ